MRIAWHAIVKDEARIIERCAASLLPHVDCAVVVDTGSTDATLDILTRIFAAAEKPLVIGHAPFVDFGRTRNDALAIARASPLDFDFLLLADADMDLVVSDPDWAKKLNGGPAYDIKQTAGGNLSYFNRRLLRRDAPASYRGPTHEFLDVPSAGVLDGVHFADHADGANRPAKLQRDIALLTSALSTESDPGLIQRYEFYLAQSYFDAGDWASAATHYRKRTTLGGYAEEAWNAQLHYAHCCGNLGNDAEFVHEMLKAYEMRPSRAETLYDLAKYYRERGENRTSLVFSTAGCAVPYPKDDALFVNDYVYRTGLDEECSICAYYDPLRRAEGARVCDRIALDRNAPAHAREQARANLYWYLSPLKDYIPSFHATQLRFDAPEPYVFTNPSVVNWRGQPLVLLRAVNYRIMPDGRYDIRDGGEAIRTRNFLLDADSMAILDEIPLPANWPREPKFDLVRGLEDCRLFVHEGRLRALACTRELDAAGTCEIVLLSLDADEWAFGTDWRALPSPEQRHEKNWMPFSDRNSLQFVYRLGTMVNHTGFIGAEHANTLAVDDMRGGTPVVTVGDDHIALVHEARIIPGQTIRYYSHRFVLLSLTCDVLAVSPPFCFIDKQIEFAAGLAYFPDRRELMVSFGAMDREAWTATMRLDEVLGFIG